MQMLTKEPDEILAIRDFGRKSLNELIDRLKDKGYRDDIPNAVIQRVESSQSEKAQVVANDGGFWTSFVEEG